MKVTDVQKQFKMLSDELLLPPDESQIKAIKAELGENTERFKNNLKLLQQWMDSQPHLPKNCGENTLALFLRGCKHDVKKAQKKLEIYFVWKTKDPNLSVREFSKMEMAELETIIVLPMPKLTQNGHRVVIYKLKDPNPDLFNMNTSVRLMWMLGQFRLYKEHTIAGDIFIFDGTHVTPAHVAKVIQLIKSTTTVLQEGWFVRIKRFYHINTTPPLEKAINFMKLFLKPKLRGRIVVDQGVSCLKELPKECLPKEYGGSELSSVELMDKWHKCMYKDNKEWFENWEITKLIGPVPKHIEDKYDFEDLQGSFRQLDFD